MNRFVRSKTAFGLLPVLKADARVYIVVGIIWGLLFLFSAPASAAYTVTPNTWNIIGLDSNGPATGPYLFPVGAKVCGGTPDATDTATFTWDAGGTDSGTYIYLRAGSANPTTITFGADGCADAFFEVEVAKDSNAFDETRRYHITAGGVSTPTPRELYVERLISQSRNGIDNIKLDGVSIPAGGSMNLIVGNTYTIELLGHTAPGGYNQFEEFINFPNTIFQVQSVSTDYSTNTSPYVSTLNHEHLYADSCKWENDPNSPNYLSCWEDWKTGNIVITTYTVKILSGGGNSETLNSLLYDFSGSSFHYNADYSTGARFANIIDPTNVTFSKSFSPNPTNVGGVSALTFTLTNPNGGAVSGLNFTDVFPTSPGSMVVATTPNATTNGCGSAATFAPSAGDASISFSNGTIAANSSCTVKVNLTAPVTGSYINTSNNLFVGTIDTGNVASDTLTVNTEPVPPAPPSACPGQEVELARWEMPASGQGSGGPPPPYTSKAADVATATTSYVSASGAQSISSAEGNPANSWGGTAPTGGNGWSEGPTDANNYFEFELDTSEYGGLQVAFDVGLFANSDWASPWSNVYVNTNADGGTFSVYSSVPTDKYPQANKGGWTTGLYATAASTGTSTTKFRFSTDGASKDASTMYIDNVIFTGCARPDPPTITKSFSPNPVAVGADSTLTFTVTNPNASSALSSVAFDDTLPDGLTVADSTTSQCGGTNNVVTTAATGVIDVTGGAIAAGGSCTITATVTATTAGPHDNVSGFVSATESGINDGSTGIATASLTALSPPSITKLFDSNPILAGGTSTLTFTITNPNQDDELSGIAFSDTFPTSPGAMVVASTPNATSSGCGTPTYAPSATDTSIAFTGGTISAGSTCTVTVDVTAPSLGDYDNTSGNVSHLINAATVNGNTDSDTLTVEAANPQISILKQVSAAAAGPWTSYVALPTGDNVYYKFIVENPGDVDFTTVFVSDPDVTLSGCSWATLTKYDTQTCTGGPVAAVAGIGVNTATATGTYSGTPYEDFSVAVYATTELTIVKSAAESYFVAADDVLNYSYVVSNSGDAILTGPVTVADDKSSDESCPAVSTAVLSDLSPGDGDNYLDPDEQITCTATYTVLAADVTAKLVTNLASATIDGVTSPTDTVTVPLAMPSLLILKSVQVFSDPINGEASPKAIPGSFMTYTILVTNTGPGKVDDSTTVITDPIPANTEFFVGDINGAGSGPVLFTDGTTASGLCYDYATPAACAGDNIQFSKTASPGPYVYDATPTSDGNGCDTAITSLKVTLGDILDGSDGTNHPSFSLKFRVRVK